MHTKRKQTERKALGHAPALLAVVVVSSLLIAAHFPPAAYAQQRIVISDDPALTVDAGSKAAIIDRITRDLNAEYIFEDAAAKMEEHVRGRLEAGAYDAITSLVMFTRQLTMDLQSVSKDLHLAVLPEPPRPAGEPEPQTDDDRRRQEEERRYQNYGFRKLELLPGNIGYVDLRMFADAGAAGDTAVAAMNFLANCSALIFDLRQNGGGSPSMIQLITSYLFDEPKHLNSFYIRRDDSTRQFWTQARVQGPRLADVPVFVLTSGYTFSGAEEFTYNLKNMERAVIIGETTGGGAHPVEFRYYEDLNVSLKLPFGRAVNPISGTNWEGTGIEPHIAVPASEALDVARIEAMKTLLEKESDETRRARLEWALQGLEARRKPVALSMTEMEPYLGAYGPRRIRLEEGALVYQRDQGQTYRLYPMGDDVFGLEDLEYFRIRFVRNEDDIVIKLIGLYDNGTTDGNDRTGS